VDLLVVQLKAAIRRLLDNKGVRARVLDKVNRYGEVVIGVILERPPPPRRVSLPHDEVRHRDKDDGQDNPRDLGGADGAASCDGAVAGGASAGRAAADGEDVAT
jgi:hypothetical protein